MNLITDLHSHLEYIEETINQEPLDSGRSIEADNPVNSLKIDKAMKSYMSEQKYPVNVEKVNDGIYLFNNVKKVFIKILRGVLVVRVGGGFVTLTEYIE